MLVLLGSFLLRSLVLVRRVIVGLMYPIDSRRNFLIVMLDQQQLLDPTMKKSFHQ